jgi:hypothetical protein
MSDTLSGLLGFALIAGLFVKYAMDRRAQKRAAHPDSIVSPEAASGIETEPATAVAPEPRARSSSPNWGMPIVYCLLLVGADTHRANFWGYLWQGLYFALFAVACYSTFSPKELAAEQARRPNTTRLDHYVTLGVPYVLFPAAGWILVEPVGWSPGILVPALPWALLLVVAGVVSVLPKGRDERRP